MAAEVEGGASETKARVDKVTQQWQQGDVLPLTEVIHGAKLSAPLLDASRRLADIAEPSSELVAVHQPVEAVVVITGTCNLIRSCSERPFVHVSPVVRLAGPQRQAAADRMRPQYAALPGYGDDAFADFDRVTTLEKSVLLDHSPVRGLPTDTDVSRFAQDAGRTLSRFAFPDEFVATIKPLRRMVGKKYDKVESPEGQLLRQVREIRVHASWSDDEIEVLLVFIVDPGALVRTDEPFTPSVDLERLRYRPPTEIAKRIIARDVPDDALAWLWQRLIDRWLADCTPVAPIVRVFGEIASADEYTYDRLMASEKLDLDSFSEPRIL